jgi:hypothetical protein
LCDTAPTLIVLHVNLVQHFINATSITTDNWSLLTGNSYRQMQLQLIYDRQSVGQSVLVSGTHLGPMTNFSFSLKFLLDSCGFVSL